jgi:hypothetical protein
VERDPYEWRWDEWWCLPCRERRDCEHCDYLRGCECVSQGCLERLVRETPRYGGGSMYWGVRAAWHLRL